MEILPDAAYRNYVGGEWVDAVNGATEGVVNPTDGSVLTRVPKGGRDDAKRAIDAAREAFDKGPWPRMTPGDRSGTLLRLASLIEADVDRIAVLETMDQGKTIKQSRDSDIPIAVDNLRFMAGACRALTTASSAEYLAGATSYLRREPIGVVGSITPWNYPFQMAIWKIAPALAAGNAVVLKPASVTPVTTLELAKLAERAGLPKGALNVITGPGADVGAELASSRHVDMVSLTGDTTTGREIMSLASASLKRLHLELGGKAPFVVFDDADIEAAAEGAVVGNLVNGGQDCTQAARFYVHESIHDAFLRRVTARLRSVRIGDPMDRSTDLGPLVSRKQRDKVASYVTLGGEEGARVAYAGKAPAQGRLAKGFFHGPAVLDGCAQDMRVVQEEIFGPVMTVLTFRDEDEALAKANGTAYGLYGSVWTKDVQRATRFANGMQCGAVGVNDHLPFASEMPHGGCKASGFGKDLSVHSLEEYTQLKHVFVELTGTSRKPWHYTVYGDAG
jgi:betaine-aldehyde dehydrogenase